MDSKKLFLSSMVPLISTPTAHQTDPALHMECLNIVRLWLLEPENGGKMLAWNILLHLAWLA